MREPYGSENWKPIHEDLEELRRELAASQKAAAQRGGGAKFNCTMWTNEDFVYNLSELRVQQASITNRVTTVVTAGTR